jgi:hypothetical protein
LRCEISKKIDLTSNNGFMGNLPYGYLKNSLPSSIINRTLQSLRQHMNDRVITRKYSSKCPQFSTLATQMGKLAGVLGVQNVDVNNINNANSMNNANYVDNAESIQMHQVIKLFT